MSIELVLDGYMAEPRGSFTGSVMVQSPGDNARAVRISLRYRTEGRGDTDSLVLAEQELLLDPEASMSTPRFVLAVPSDSPVSYDGHLIRVIHEIEARLDIKMGRDIRVEQRVLIVPVGGIHHYDRPHPLPSSNPLPW